MAEEGQVIACHDLRVWHGQIRKGYESNKLIVVYLTAPWCVPCKFMAPVVDELAKKFANVMFLKVDVDVKQLKYVPIDFGVDCGVESMPTFVFLKNDDVLDKLVGADKVKLEQLTERHATVA
ncbi:hypothetical protein Tsubulata_030942 [Turnera subulata]|uniref:Thioredoxin domain-containing protein n=1 Tax=Turnera subulata TaxID=218843 RepID=A0A9Q0FXA3_9ROSI|nr:hypothetical protein Tsubulata_030942 [Turnera subulata]